MNLNSLWRPRRKRSSRCSRARTSCVGSTLGHDQECFSIQRRMEQFDDLLSAEHARIQDHIEELAELRCELETDCQCRNKFERQLSKMEKRVMKLRAEMQDCRKYLLDSDCYLHQNEQRQRELQHRLQELWNLISECCQSREIDVESVKVIATTSVPVQPQTAVTTGTTTNPPPATTPPAPAK